MADLITFPRPAAEPDPACEVCDGAGVYLIKNKFGEGRYLIVCPECDGKMPAAGIVT